MLHSRPCRKIHTLGISVASEGRLTGPVVTTGGGMAAAAAAVAATGSFFTTWDFSSSGLDTTTILDKNNFTHVSQGYVNARYFTPYLTYNI